jgi:hypothetical protein
VFHVKLHRPYRVGATDANAPRSDNLMRDVAVYGCDKALDLIGQRVRCLGQTTIGRGVQREQLSDGFNT